LIFSDGTGKPEVCGRTKIDAARNLPDGTTSDGYGIKVDERYLKLNPDPLGPQHDEREPGRFGIGQVGVVPSA
jgi:hypothetical protein